MNIRCILLLAILTATCSAEAARKEMRYRDFIDHLRDGAVSSVAFHDDGLIGEFAGESWTNVFLVRGTLRRYHSDPLLWDELKAAGITPATKKGENPPLRILIMALLPHFLWPTIFLAVLVSIILLHRKMNRMILLLNTNGRVANKTRISSDCESSSGR